MDSGETPHEGQIPRIERRTLHDEVLTRLRDMIIEGRLLPGARINEGLIGKQLGVSRTPLREAIKSLCSEGLVDVIPAKGAVVRQMDARELADTLEAIRLIEEGAGRALCARGSDADIARIKALHDDMMRYYAARERLPYFKCNQDIHSAIVAGGGNAVLGEVHASLQARIKRLRYIGNEGPEKWAGAVAEHEAMIVALNARDGEKLAAILGNHLASTMNRVKDSLGS